jgi:hypothetical protein
MVQRRLTNLQFTLLVNDQVVPIEAMKACGRTKVELHAFLTSALSESRKLHVSAARSVGTQ